MNYKSLGFSVFIGLLVLLAFPVNMLEEKVTPGVCDIPETSIAVCAPSIETSVSKRPIDQIIYDIFTNEPAQSDISGVSDTSIITAVGAGVVASALSYFLMRKIFKK